MAVRSPADLKMSFSRGSMPDEEHFADLIDSAGGYGTVSEMLTQKTRFATGDIVRAAGFRYRVVSETARAHLVTGGGVGLRFLRSSQFVPVAAFGAAGDGKADDIAALERWRDYVEEENLVGLLDGRTYMVSRTLRLTARGSFVGCDGTVIKATRSFATNFRDPVANALAPGLAPVLFLDGRIEAIGLPNRMSRLECLALDGNGVAAHGLLAAGVAAGNLIKVHVDNVTVASFVICGVQNARIVDLKGMAGEGGALPREAALWILNGAKNTIFESCDMACAMEETPAILRIGVSADYPGPGRSRSAIADAPALLTFLKGVVETQGHSREPRRMILVEAGSQIRFIDINIAGAATKAAVEIGEGANGIHFDGGATNGLGCVAPFVVNRGRNVVLTLHAVWNFKGTGCLIENDDNGRVFFAPPENGLFGGFSSVFGGSAHHAQNRFQPSGYYGDAEAKAGARADSATGARWWDSARNHETVWIDGAALTPDGMPVSQGEEDSKGWPLLTDADLRSGVLDLKGYSKVTLRFSAPVVIEDMTAMRSGQEVTLAFDDGHATFLGASRLRLTDDAPSVNPQARNAMSFARANGSNLSGEGPQWIQTGGPVGLSSAVRAELEDPSHPINAIGKRLGKSCWNMTDGKLFIAMGPGAADPWAPADGAAPILPS